jgi:hypothetical protein
MPVSSARGDPLGRFEMESRCTVSEREEMGLVSSINQFPWQDDILRTLSAAGARSIAQISAAVAVEAGQGVDSGALREGIALNVDHLVDLGLAEYPDGRPAATTLNGHDALLHTIVALSRAGQSAADSLP